MKFVKNFLLLVVLFSCQKEAETDFPLIQTGEVTSISEKGAAFHARLVYVERSDIDEYGFVWDENKEPEYLSSEKIIFKGSPERDNTISSFISTTLIPDKIYFVRAYVKSNTHIVYGRTVSFISLGSGAPGIENFHPKEGNLGDTLTLTGSNFSYQMKDNIVLFEKEPGMVTYATQDTLKVIVPESLKDTTSTLTVSIKNNQAAFGEKFKLLAPKIMDFYPREANLKDTIIIVGENLALDRSKHSVKTVSSQILIGNTKSHILYSSPDTLMVSISENMAEEYAEILITNHNHLQGSAEEKFKLKAPVILDFYPKTGNLKDTLTIIGKNFTTHNNPVNKTEVNIGTEKASILRLSHDTVVVSVSENLNQEISLLELGNHNGLKQTTENEFMLNRAQITGFSPEEGSLGSTITISGENFHPQVLEVFIGGQKAFIQEAGKSQLKVEVPFSLLDVANEVSVVMNNLSSKAADIFTVPSLILEDFTPKIIQTGELMTITGKNFHPLPERNKVTFANNEGEVTQASFTQLTVRIPSQASIKKPYPSRNISLSVEVLGVSKTFDEELVIDDTWFRITDFPGRGYDKASYNYESFVIDNTAYFGGVGNSQFWSLDLNTLKWESIGIPGYEGLSTIFSAKGVIYIGTPSVFWMYPIKYPWWYRNNDTGEEGSVISHGFSFQDKPYVVIKEPSEAKHKIWRFKVKETRMFEGGWEHVTDFPTVPEAYILDFTQANDNHLFLGLREADDPYQSKMFLYMYSFETDTWSPIADYPADGGKFASLNFVHNNELYLKSSHSQNFWKYNQSADQWEEEPGDLMPPNSTVGGTSFRTNEKVYVGLGSSGAIWEYDPNR
jgi:hypothetical protein